MLLLRWHWWEFLSLNNWRLRFSRNHYHHLIVLDFFSVTEHKSRGAIVRELGPRYMAWALEPLFLNPKLHSTSYNCPHTWTLSLGPDTSEPNLGSGTQNKTILNTSSKPPQSFPTWTGEFLPGGAPYPAARPCIRQHHYQADGGSGNQFQCHSHLSNETATLRWWNWTSIRTKKEK